MTVVLRTVKTGFLYFNLPVDQMISYKQEEVTIVQGPKRNQKESKESQWEVPIKDNSFHALALIGRLRNSWTKRRNELWRVRGFNETIK